MMCRMLQQMKHILGGLFEIRIARENGEGDVLWEEINFEDITLVHGVLKVAAKTAVVVFKGWANVPTNFAVLAELGATLGVDMSNNVSAKQVGQWGFD
jgi:hypothetical protein